MEQALKYEHKGITITYSLGGNNWSFTLRGRERSADSLQKAIEAIDKPDPKEKAFDPMPCLVCRYGGKWTTGKVTSIANRNEYEGGKYVWISTSDGRETRAAGAAYLDTDANREKMNRCIAINAQIGKLIKESEDLVKTMETVQNYLDKLEGGKA